MTYTPTPAWQPGEAITEEPPIGSTVRIGREYFRLGRDGTSWFDPSDMHRYSWSQLEVIAGVNQTDIVFVSDTEARPPTFTVGEVITPEMGEPPVGSVVEDGEGDRWTHAERDFFPWIIPGRESNSSWENLGRLWSPITLVSLPDSQPEEPKPLDMPEPEAKPSPSLADALGKAAQIMALSSADHSAEHDRAALYALFLGWGSEADLERVGKRWGWTLDQRNEIRAMRQVIYAAQLGKTETPTPQPQTREVPLSEAREGDWMTVHREIIRDDDGELCILVNHDRVGLGHFLPGFIATVTRQQNPLPTTPGSVGTATVRGVPGVRAYLMAYTPGPTRPWRTSRMVGGWEWHSPDDLADYDPLLEGEAS